MESLHEAQFYERLPGNEVLCTLCPHDCRIPYTEPTIFCELAYDVAVLARARPPGDARRTADPDDLHRQKG